MSQNSPEEKEKTIIGTMDIKQAEAEVNVCFEHLSKGKYQLLRANEDLKNAQIETKLLEAKLKFMRESEIPAIQDKIKYMRGSLLNLENSLKKILEE